MANHCAPGPVGPHQTWTFNFSHGERLLFSQHPPLLPPKPLFPGTPPQLPRSATLPLHLCFFLLTLFLFIAFSWYMSYESALESLIEQVKFLFMVSPLVLLLVVHLMSSRERRHVPFFAPLPEHQQPFYCSRGRAGGSPWGVALVLVLLMFMISYQSYFHERWFPLLSR
uniref:Uncharacterized protein n=1 Tax=Ananas comosus var. bracteatus TaxID=296719 RepID=A0A6V7P8M5_ANACO|nr:unnamed protein product [Ananas comosus var. bracteatus]